MNKFILTLLTFCFCGFSYSQTAKLGKFEQEEIELTEVAFEKDAPAVVLLSQGESRFIGGFLETTHFVRMKILSDAGKEYADVRLRFYVGDDRTEDITGVKAQSTNFSNGNMETIKVEKDGIFEVELDNGYREMRISFPNVQVGSILEYTYKKSDKNLTFIDGWTFQKEIPTLTSTYKITMPSYLDYRTVGQGENFTTKVEKKQEYDSHSWTLRDLHSLKEEPYMKNYRDYVERIEFQLAAYKNSDGNWTDVLNTWEALGDDIVSIYRDKGYYRGNPIEKEFLDVDITGATQKEVAEKAYYYLRDNFRIEGDDWIYPKQSLNQLLKSKVGSPVELMLTLMGVLKSEGISCDPVLIGSKGYGRSSLVPFPFLNQFDEILLLAEVDGKQQFLDLTNPRAPFGYVDLDKHVAAGLYLQKESSNLIPIDIQHKSNASYFSRVGLGEEGNLQMSQVLRNYYYRGLDLVENVEEKQKNNESLEELFSSDNDIVFANFEVEDMLHDRNFVELNYKMTFPGTSEEDMILFKPLQFSSFSKNPFTQEYRMFPVDFGYEFSEIYNTVIDIPEGYELDDFPLRESITIPGGYVSFVYETANVAESLKISSKLDVKIPLIPASEYANLKYFMESVASKLSEPVILVKKTGN